MHLFSFWGDSKCSLGSVCHVHKICSPGSGPPTFRPFLLLPTGRGSMAQMAVRGNFVFMHFVFTLYAFCNFHFCIVANLYFCILYNSLFDQRWPRVGESVCSGPGMSLALKYYKAFLQWNGARCFLFKCGIILKKKQSSTGKPAKLGIIPIIPFNLISSN